MRPPSLAVTLGDPRGIGPEVAFEAARRLAGRRGSPSLVWVVPAGWRDRPEPPGGRHHVEEAWDGSEEGAGRVSVACLRAAVELARAGEVAGVVTGPVHKPALHGAGYVVPGQTELLGSLCGAPRTAMLMAAERARRGAPLRVLLATTHVPLRDVAGLVTEALLVGATTLLHEGLRIDWRIVEPRIALCALNPHASDRGLFGDEEARVYEPARTRLAAAGIEVPPPLPADTVFGRALAGDFDAVVCPYHDVGMAAFKTATFGRGVNVTLGLPFVRTSPDHGTAFDIAGTGAADASSMLAAIRLAARLAANRLAAGGGPFDTPRPDV